MPESSFNDMLVELMPRMRVYAMWLTRNRASADDLVQEAACRALHARSQFTMGTNFPAWIFRILRNEFISSLRRSKRISVPIEDVPESLFMRPPNQEDFVYSRQVLRATEQLRPEQKIIVDLICATGLSYNEAAVTVDCSVGTIKSRLWRARQHIEALLQDNKPTSISTAKHSTKRAQLSSAKAPS